MSDKLTADDLSLARIRARHLEPPARVAADLVEAADHPERLDHVSREDVLWHAADVLVRAGEYEQALTLLRGIPGQLAGRLHAKALMEAGDPDGAEAIIREFSADDGWDARLNFVIGMIHFATTGHYQHALRCADATEEWDSRHGGVDDDFLQEARAKIRADQAGLADAAESTGSPAGPSAPTATAYTPWWSQADYARLSRQLPEFTAVIGTPWRQHVANVEAALRDQARADASGQRLLRVDFESFLTYCLLADVDLRTRAALDRYAQPGRETGEWLASPWQPAAADTRAWPPQPKEPCWCGSGRRYKKCCDVSAAG